MYLVIPDKTSLLMEGKGSVGLPSPTLSRERERERRGIAVDERGMFAESFANRVFFFFFHHVRGFMNVMK